MPRTSTALTLHSHTAGTSDTSISRISTAKEKGCEERVRIKVEEERRRLRKSEVEVGAEETTSRCLTVYHSYQSPKGLAGGGGGAPPCIFLCFPLIFLYFPRKMSENPVKLIKKLCIVLI